MLSYFDDDFDESFVDDNECLDEPPFDDPDLSPPISGLLFTDVDYF